jgi:hypothetical protein
MLRVKEAIALVEMGRQENNMWLKNTPAEKNTGCRPA